MKKIKFVGIAILACFALASCTTDSLIKKYEKACKDHDVLEAAEIAIKLDQKELTEEQEARILKASEDLY